MAHLSDVLLQVAVVVYLAAMTGYLVEYAFGTRGAVARVAGRRDRELVAVGAAADPLLPLDVAPVSPAPGSGAAVAATPKVGRTGRLRRDCGRTHRRRPGRPHRCAGDAWPGR